MNACKQCVHWLQWGDILMFGQCRAHPPCVQAPGVIHGTSLTPRGAWLDTHEDETCGEFKPKPPAK
jgi:hypothetical protein